MNYELQINNDVVSGASVTITIPEYELDKKALYTIEATMPDFILPFHHRSIDGQVELVYMTGQHSKLQYFSGNRQPKEYAELWLSVLRPLLACGDWFLRSYCFLINIDHLYYNKNNNSISYIYIPSKRECSDYDTLRDMAIELSSMVSVVDTDIENRVLRSIMKDFNPKNFISLLNPYLTVPAPLIVQQPLSESSISSTHGSHEHKGEEIVIPERIVDESRKGGDYSQSTYDDIVINFPQTGKNNRKYQNVEKDSNYPESGRKKDASKADTGMKLFSKKKSAKTDKTSSETSVDLPGNELPFAIMQTSVIPAKTDDTTQILAVETPGARLRFVGTIDLPEIIEVPLNDSGVFTIGRFDSSVGRSQSSFEFDKKTKGVSRRHAVIERSSDVFSIIDLSSSAGTFVDRKRIPPNTPQELESGSRISFGSSGANYVWET